MKKSRLTLIGFLCLAIIFSFSACGGGSEDEVSSTPSTLTIAGSDTAVLGTKLILHEHVFGRADLTGYNRALISTSEGVMDLFLDENSDPSDVDLSNMIVFISSDIDISMTIRKNSIEYRYVMGCENETNVELCPSIALNTNAKTITFTNSVVEPVIGGDEPESHATDQLVINGVISWE